MDCLKRFLSPRLVVMPLLGAILICLPWLALRLAAPPNDTRVGWASPTETERLAVDNAQPFGNSHSRGVVAPPSPVSQPPSTLGTTSPEGAKLLKLAAAGRDGSAVLAAAFPAMPANPDSSAAVEGPQLFAPRLPTAPVLATAPRTATPAGPPRTLSQPAGSLLLPPEAAAARSEQLEKTARQADQQVRHGFELANRGACYAARAEFVAGLRLLAQALDAERHTTHHSRSLAAALTALKEAGDFLPAGGKLEADLDLPAIIASHRTPILKEHGGGEPRAAGGAEVVLHVRPGGVQRGGRS